MDIDIDIDIDLDIDIDIYIYPFEDSEISLRGPRGSARSCSPSPRTFSLEVARSSPLLNFRRPRRHFERAFLLDLAVLALEPARPSSPRRRQASIFEAERAVFRTFFRSSVRSWRGSTLRAIFHRFFDVFSIEFAIDFRLLRPSFFRSLEGARF